MVMGNNKSATTKMRANHWQIYCHADAAIQHGAHRLIEHIQGFTWSHRMPPLGGRRGTKSKKVIKQLQSS
jgi:hypothetical protein